jgi:uncharacterized protein involved in type VI secretion and phage assembly
MDILDLDVEADATAVYADAAAISWDVQNQKPRAARVRKPGALGPGNLKPVSVARDTGATMLQVRTSATLPEQEINDLVSGLLARSHLSLVRGRVSVWGDPTLMPLMGVELQGLGQTFSGRALVTGVRHYIDENGYTADIQVGLTPERFAARPDIPDLPAAGALPSVRGLQIGKVTSITDESLKEYQVLVNLPAAFETRQTVTARVLLPQAGNEHGFFFLPEVDDEVLVGFVDDDPRQAVILGGLYSSKAPPAGSLGEIDKHNRIKGITTPDGAVVRFVSESDRPAIHIETKAGNSVIINDNEQSIVLKDQHGNTVTMDKNGVIIKSAKDVILEASGNLTLKGSKVDVK